MTIVGGNLERKEIGVPIGVSGTHNSTEINKTTGFLQLMEVDIDGQGNPIFAEQGSWTSDVIDLGDKFQDYEKVFTTNTIGNSSSFSVLTRVSDNSKDWSDWVAIAEDGAIQSETKQYIQVRIDLFAGFMSDEFIIAKADFEKNDFIEQKKVSDALSIVPKLTSNTSSTEGFAFSETQLGTGYQAWKAFDKADTSEGYCSKSGTKTGILGFCFKERKRVTKYKLRSAVNTQYVPSMPKSWVLQGSNDTTDGINGNWYNLDTQTNQIWTTAITDKVYEIPNKSGYLAYRIKFSENNGYTSYTGIGEMDFYEEGTTSLSLKRDYKYDMTLDETWSDTGSLHRKKVTRDDWVKIDRLYTI